MPTNRIASFIFMNAEKKTQQEPYLAALNVGLTTLQIATSRMCRNDSRLMQGLRHALAVAQQAETVNKLSRSTRVNT